MRLQVDSSRPCFFGYNTSILNKKLIKCTKKNNWDTESLLDKIRRKEYTKLKEKPTHTSIFDDDAVADSAVDYLYDNQSKTQSFLKNSGFPSLPDRDFNKQLYGVQEEKRQLRDMLKSKTNSILNAKLPTETDRAFLHGLMGEKDGEDDYQKQISDATRAKSDLLSAFRGTPFESGLKPSVPTKDALPLKAAVPETKPVTDDKPDVTKESAHVATFKSNNNYDIAQRSNNKVLSLNANDNERDIRIKENAKMNDKPVWNVRRSSNIIEKNASVIKSSAAKYGVNPSIVAACIYSEQMLNYNITDLVRDKMYWDNPTVGIGQVSIETAKTIENNTNIEKIKYLGKKQEWHGNNSVTKDSWYIPGYGTFLGTHEQAISKRLSIDEQCVEYVTAYLKLIQDLWREQYPIIDGKTDILATLYNIGERGGEKGIHSNPESNPFGDFAKANYYYMQYLLGL